VCGAAAARLRRLRQLLLGAELGLRPLVAHCHLALATLYRRAGRSGPPDEHLAAAITMYRALDTAWLDRAETVGG
jgi:hypothetical protein